MATVIITGGTGMIGKELASTLLKKGYEVIIFSRSGANGKGENSSQLSYAKWDVEKQEIDATAIARADYIIHLAGAGVADKRWSKKRKEEIVDSRVKSGELISKSLAELPNKVKAVVSISGIGWYGPDPVVPNPHPFTENDKPFHDFLADTCKQWEASLAPVIKMNRRLIIFRAGIVLSDKGGALAEFEKPLKFGLATILGSGRQVISWIHVTDLVHLFISAIENENWNGVYNAVSPFPVTNKELIVQLAKIKRGKFFIPVYVPSFALKIALGEMSIEVLKSATVSSAKASLNGFEFAHPRIEEALNDLVKPRKA